MSDEQRHTWAIDGLAPTSDPRDHPRGYVVAHLIVDDGVDVKVTACGIRHTRGTHPRGWYGMTKQEIHRYVDHVHCGLDPDTVTGTSDL